MRKGLARVKHCRDAKKRKYNSRAAALRAGTQRCRDAKKRKYNSRAAALRAGTQRYGTTSNAYRCAACGSWHLTRQGVPKHDEDPELDQLVDALLGTGGAR